MTSNPYFFKDQNIINTSNKLLSETIGTEEIPINVFEIPEYIDANLEFNYDKFTNNKELGLSEISKSGYKIYINANIFGASIEEAKNDLTKWRRCRFTLAHELGHCFLPNHVNLEIQSNFQEKSQNAHKYYYLKNKEYEADSFASELLIPNCTINKNFLDDSKNLLINAKKLSESHNVSIQVAIMQIIASSTCNIGVCIFINPTNGKIMSYKATNEFRYYGKGLSVDVKTEVPKYTIAEKLIKGDSRQEGIPNTIDIFYWFPNYYGDENAKLTECSVHFNHYILTYLELTDTSIYDF